MKTPAIAVLSALFALALFAMCQSRGSSNAGTKADTLRILTYNIHHANPPSKAKEGTIDIEAIAKVINNAKPDLVALQEVDVQTERSGKDLHEAKALAELTGMRCYFARAMHYGGGQYGDAVLSRFPIADSATYNLPIEEGAKEEIRSLCVIKVKLPKNQEIHFASTHLGLSEATRLLQAHKLLEVVKAFKLPLVIGGDFNAAPNSEVIKLLDSELTRSCLEDCAFTIPVNKPNHKIDYIMYRPSNRFNVVKQEVINETYASDHLPVLVTLTY